MGDILNYGKQGRLTTEQIQEAAPDWMIYRDGCPGREAPEQVATRVDRGDRPFPGARRLERRRITR